MRTVHAPWSEDTIEALLWWQENMHPYTCGNHSDHRPLVPQREGWICLDCAYTQDWATVPS